MAIVVKCPNTPFGFECLAHSRSNEGPCKLRALPLFEITYRAGGEIVRRYAEFRGAAERYADRLRRHHGLSVSVRPYRKKDN